MRTQFAVLVTGLAIVLAACGTATPDAEIAVNVPETITTVSAPAVEQTTTTEAAAAPQSTTTTAAPAPEQTTATTAAAVPINSAAADELRVAFIDAVTSGDLGKVEELLAEAQPDPDIISTITVMMQEGTEMSAGTDSCTDPDGCYVFTDRFQAFTLQMEADAAGDWAIIGISLESTD